MRSRPATPADAAVLARIYDDVLDERTATFETKHKTEHDVLAWFDGAHPMVVVEDDDGSVIAFARTGEYSPRECYRGVFDFGVYVDRAHRRRGAGMVAMRELVTASRSAGAWKLVSRVFVENQASRTLLGTLGFREVGVFYRHAKLDGEWRDVVAVEKFLAPIGGPKSMPPPGRAPREEVLADLRSEEAEARSRGLEAAKVMTDVFRRSDVDLLDSAVESFFGSKTRDAATRARYVELFRTYATLSPETAREAYEAIFARLEKLAIGAELELFYEALFVVKQVAGADAKSLAPQAGRLLGWIEQLTSIVNAPRGRISPGNVLALLMPLGLAAAESDEQRARVVELASEARGRLRVEPPASLRSPPTTPPPPPTPTVASEAPTVEVPAVDAPTVEAPAVEAATVEVPMVGAPPPAEPPAAAPSSRAKKKGAPRKPRKKKKSEPAE